jgi:hypothetical protein
VVAAVIGAKRNLAQFRLARGGAIFGALDSMCDRIPDQVNQGIRNLLNDVVIELGLAAGKVEIDLLAR